MGSVNHANPLSRARKEEREGVVKSGLEALFMANAVPLHALKVVLLDFHSSPPLNHFTKIS